MKRYLVFFILQITLCFQLTSQDLNPPAVSRDFSSITNYEELSAYIVRLDKVHELLETEIIGQSVLGRNLYAMKFSASEFGKDLSKTRVIIFAQQHGNEQSGKEGALLLARELVKDEYRYLFDRIDLLLIAQVNPDGSEANQRRNAHGVDLNRNHLTLTEPETQALHRIFDRYRFEVTMDVHEYSPYGDDWRQLGFRKNSEVTVGTLTNPNVAEDIRRYSREIYLPFVLRYLQDRGFSSLEYYPGGPPGTRPMRRSTFDINDGRQGFGIQNTLSFIQEGMNGTDSYLENLSRRAAGQMAGMMGLLEFVFSNHAVIKDMVLTARERVITGEGYERIAIQAKHEATGQALGLPAFSYATGSDTLADVKDFLPEVMATLETIRPLGYLVPMEMTGLTEWMVRHSFFSGLLKKGGNYRVESLFIESIDSADFEGDKVVDPQVITMKPGKKFRTEEYFFLPTAQPKGNLLVMALEPRSMTGLLTYKEFASLLVANDRYPVLRVVKK